MASTTGQSLIMGPCGKNELEAQWAEHVSLTCRFVSF